MNNVILVGYMGCGKTTVGIRLSYRLKIPFLDTDKEIEKDHNCVISDVFATLGEETFRNWETESLVKLCKNNAVYVISTGGGMVLREENRRLLKKLGTVIYLRAKPETIAERLKGDTTRPLLQTENPVQRIQEMLQKRASIYEQAADVILDVDDKSFEEILDEIERKLA